MSISQAVIFCTCNWQFSFIETIANTWTNTNANTEDMAFITEKVVF